MFDSLSTPLPSVYEALMGNPWENHTLGTPFSLSYSFNLPSHNHSIWSIVHNDCETKLDKFSPLSLPKQNLVNRAMSSIGQVSGLKMTEQLNLYRPIHIYIIEATMDSGGGGLTLPFGKDGLEIQDFNSVIHQVVIFLNKFISLVEFFVTALHEILHAAGFKDFVAENEAQKIIHNEEKDADQASKLRDKKWLIAHPQCNQKTVNDSKNDAENSQQDKPVVSKASTTVSVMAYKAKIDEYSGKEIVPEGLGLYDIVTLQHIFGMPEHTNNENKIEPMVRSYRRKGFQPVSIQTISDFGADNTLDASYINCDADDHKCKYATQIKIDFRPGETSAVLNELSKEVHYTTLAFKSTMSNVILGVGYNYVRLNTNNKVYIPADNRYTDIVLSAQQHSQHLIVGFDPSSHTIKFLLSHREKIKKQLITRTHRTTIGTKQVQYPFATQVTVGNSSIILPNVNPEELDHHNILCKVVHSKKKIHKTKIHLHRNRKQLHLSSLLQASLEPNDKFPNNTKSRIASSLSFFKPVPPNNEGTTSSNAKHPPSKTALPSWLEKVSDQFAGVETASKKFVKWLVEDVDTNGHRGAGVLSYISAPNAVNVIAADNQGAKYTHLAETTLTLKPRLKTLG